MVIKKSLSSLLIALYGGGEFCSEKEYVKGLIHDRLYGKQQKSHLCDLSLTKEARTEIPRDSP